MILWKVQQNIYQFKYKLISSFSGTLNKVDYDSVLLWYEQSLPPNPSICFRFMKIKNLIFRIFSIDGKFDYLVMLLAFCKDTISIIGLIKAISLLMDQNIMLDQYDNNVYKNNSINLPMETLYKTLLVCLKNYLVNYDFISLRCFFYQKNMVTNYRLQIKVTSNLWYLRF